MRKQTKMHLTCSMFGKSDNPYQGNIHSVSRASCERSDVSQRIFLEEIVVTQHFKPSKPFCLSFLFSSVDDNQFMMDM